MVEPLARGAKLIRWTILSGRRQAFSFFSCLGRTPFHDEAGNIIKARESGSEGELKMVENDEGKTTKLFGQAGCTGHQNRHLTNLQPFPDPGSSLLALKIVKGDFTSEGYDFTQRAYILNSPDNNSDLLQVELAASNDSPVVNVCMLINGWETDRIVS